MIIDSKGKLFGKVSIIDLLIVFVVAAGVAGMGYKFAKSGKGAVVSTGNKIVMTFYGEDSPDFAVESIKKGDPARDYERGTNLGNVIEEVKIDNSVRYGEKANGEKVVISKEGYPAFYITVEGAGTLNSLGGIMINGAEYQIGRTIILKVGASYVPTRLYSFELKN
ncbi:MAG: DUF4330 domain-containing protein [Clostridiaceae bacterium]|nr:DUF4330 domain-containing protein [Clostridiaceae bacterium]